MRSLKNKVIVMTLTVFAVVAVSFSLLDSAPIAAYTEDMYESSVSQKPAPFIMQGTENVQAGSFMVVIDTMKEGLSTVNAIPEEKVGRPGFAA